jgi:curved DNA-binding protein CbpA
MGNELYTILGVTPDVSMGDLKKAYRDKSRRHHPDKGGDASLFRGIAEAYKILSNPQTRARYDQTGQTTAAPDVLTVSLSVLANWMKQIVDGPTNLENTDLLGLMKEQIKKELVAINENHGKAKNTLHRINHIKKHLTTNGSGAPPVLLTVMDERRSEVVAHLRQLEHGKKVMAKITELLEDYTYRYEERNVMGYVPMSFSWGGSTTTSSV